MAEVNEFLRKAREMRVMAENAGSEALSYRMRRSAHRLQRAAEEAGREADMKAAREGG
jgi:hypothetical protein